MSTLVEKRTQEVAENAELAMLFIKMYEGEPNFDFKSCIKWLMSNDHEVDAALNRADEIQIQFYKLKDDGNEF